MPKRSEKKKNLFHINFQLPRKLLCVLSDCSRKQACVKYSYSKQKMVKCFCGMVVVVVVVFSSLARILGEVFDNSFPAYAFFFLFFFEVENSSCTLIPLFRP